MSLEARWQEYKTLEPSERQAYYDTKIFPIVLAQVQGAPNKGYAVSVHTLGTSAEPVILSARTLMADRVVLLGTAQTLASVERIRAWLPDSSIRALEVNRSETGSLFAALRRELEPEAADAPLAFDITGGTKAMVAALSMLAVRLGDRPGLERRSVDVFYLNNDDWDSQMRMPKPGGERLVQLELPD